MSDHFRTIAGTAEARVKIERSDFLAIAFPITTEEAMLGELHRIEKHHFDATHHCWAFRLSNGGRTRSSDAGEPSGTAGRPILSAIEGADLHDVAVVVVRWFGGVKLGTGGLGRAYREAAAAALREAQPLDRYLYRRFRVIVPFASLSVAYRLVDPPSVVLVEERFEESNEFVFHVRQSLVDGFARTLTGKRLAFSVEG